MASFMCSRAEENHNDSTRQLNTSSLRVVLFYITKSVPEKREGLEK